MFKSLITGKLQIAMMVIVAGLLATIAWNKYTISQLENDVLELEADLVHEKAQVVIKQNVIDEKNAKAKIAEETSKKFEEEIKSLEIDIAKKDGANTALFDILNNKDAPVTCDEFGDYLRDSLEKLQW